MHISLYFTKLVQTSCHQIRFGAIQQWNYKATLVFTWCSDGRSEYEQIAGFPPIREFREIRENLEDFFQSGKSGKNRGFSVKIREIFFKLGNFFSKPFSNLLYLLI